MGSTQTLKLKGDDFGLYAADLIAGKRYQLVTDRAIRTDVLDADGEFLTTQAIGLDKVIVQYFVPKKSGRHRLWLRGGQGSYRFRLEQNVPPSLGK